MIEKREIKMKYTIYMIDCKINKLKEIKKLFP
jgi:hypothetical protein